VVVVVVMCTVVPWWKCDELYCLLRNRSTSVTKPTSS
jgi:hypothetical protein